MVWILNEAMYPEVLIKILIALALSLVIGVEREMKKKPIGLKTSAVISTFSCLLTIVSIEAAYLVPARNDINVTMDPLRLAAQIVSGIGFLGAGAILRRDNDNITGLTTAAMIWGQQVSVLRSEQDFISKRRLLCSVSCLSLKSSRLHSVNSDQSASVQKMRPSCSYCRIKQKSRT